MAKKRVSDSKKANVAKKRSSILDGLEDAIAYAQGDTTRGRKRLTMVPAKVDVKAVRTRYKLSQGAFAKRFGFAVSTPPRT